jgi:hypothetical protein
LSDLTLPEGSGLLHIGPHKTGSTALQDALDQARDELEAQGVRYVSRNRHEANAARYVTHRLVAGQNESQAERKWRRIVRELTADEPRRKVFSSEFLSDASPEQVRGIAEQLGPGTFVAVTLRSLASILPSQYQQYLQRGSTIAYEPWLEAMLSQPPAQEPTPSFWQRHRHDELINRWTESFTPDRVIVIVLDNRDFSLGPRTLEQLLGVESGTLTGKTVRTNRSMTWAEAEIMRAYNEQYKASGLSPVVHLRLTHAAGAYIRSRDPDPTEARIGTPPWAVRRANEIGAEMVDAIRSSGVAVLGDLDVLANAPVPDEPSAAPTVVDLHVAARFAAGFAVGAERILRHSGPASGAAIEDPSGDR